MKNVINLSADKARIVNSDGFDGVYKKYRVVKGDTLSRIANLNNTTVEFLAKVNDIENVDLIEIDQVLYIPEKLEEDEKKDLTVVKKTFVDK